MGKSLSAAEVGLRRSHQAQEEAVIKPWQGMGRGSGVRCFTFSSEHQDGVVPGISVARGRVHLGERSRERGYQHTPRGIYLKLADTSPPDSWGSMVTEVELWRPYTSLSHPYGALPFLRRAGEIDQTSILVKISTEMSPFERGLDEPPAAKGEWRAICGRPELVAKGWGGEEDKGQGSWQEGLFVLRLGDVIEVSLESIGVIAPRYMITYALFGLGPQSFTCDEYEKMLSVEKMPIS